jgi:hypothetical protein
LYDSISVSGVLIAIDGTPISGKPVWIEAESSSGWYNSVETTTNSNGYFESVLSFSHDDDVGSWIVYAGFDGDSDFIFSYSGDHSLFVEQPAVTTVSTNLTIDWVTTSVQSGDSLFVSGTLTTFDGIPISGKSILISINDEDGEGTGVYAITNSNGQFETNFEILSGFKTSEWTAQAFFDEDTNYFASTSNTQYFSVESHEEDLPVPVIIAFDYIFPVQSGDSVLISGSLNTLDDTPLSGKTILILIHPDNGEIGHGEYVTTGYDGRFVLDFYNTSDADIGTWTAQAEFEGDVDYLPSFSDPQYFSVIASPEPVYANVSFTNPRSVDAFGNVLTNIGVSQQIQIATDVTNYSNFSQDFAYYISIRGTEVEAWITGSLSSGQSFSPALSWVPTEAGTFTVDISLFDNIENKHKLSESVTLQIIVTEPEPLPPTLLVTITDSVMGDGHHVDLEFSEIHVNYEIIATQNGETILQETGHAMEMTGANYHIDAIGYDDNPIDLEIVSLGIGLPGDESNWTGPIGLVATTRITTGPSPEPQISIIVYTDQASYDADDIISVIGVITNYSYGDITLLVTDPEGDSVEIQQLTPGTDGYFFPHLVIGPTYDSSGTYTITVNHNGYTATTTFEFTLLEPDSGETLYPDLYFTPLQNRIEVGTPLKFSGHLTADELHVTGKTIYIKDDIDFGVDRLIISATTDQNGEFSVTWDAVLRTSGSYDLYAVFEGDSEAFRARSATYSVYVSTEPVPPPPTGNNVEIPLGSSGSGCVTTNSCLSPSTISVDVGDTVKWYNADTSKHTVTSGNISDDVVGTVFDSSIIISGSTFEVTFSQDGTFPYFCVIHPWVLGTVIVGDGGGPILDQTISITTDRSSYTTGDTINVSGSVSQDTQNLAVSLLITNPEGYIVTIDQLTVAEDGSFAFSFNTGGALMDESGAYTIRVQYGKAVAETTFTFTSEPKISASVLVLDPLPTTVNREDFVLITGKLKTESGMPITFRTINLINDNDGVVATSTTTNSNGEFTFSWNVKYTYNTYRWYAEFTGDSQFLPSHSEIQSVSIKLHPDLYFAPLSNRILIGTSLEFSGQLTIEGLPVTGKTIYIKDDIDFGTDRLIISATTDQNGEFSVTWDPVVRSSGSYDFYAVFEGDSEAFRARSATYSVYVSLIQISEPVRVYTEKTVFSEGDSLRIFGSATPNEELEIALVDSRENIIMQKSVKVDSTGSFSMVFFTWNSSSNLNFGEYGIVVWSLIDMRYDGLWVSFIKLEPETFQTKITLNRPQSSVILNEPITFTGQLLTTDGQPLTFTTVGIATVTNQVPEALQTGTTDSSGKFSITWTSRYTSSSATIPVYAYFNGNQVFDHSVSDSYSITIEKPSLSLFTEKTNYKAGELLIAYGYGSPGDTITVSLRSQQGQIMSNSVKVASDSSYTIFFDLTGLSQGSYTVTAISSSFGITDSTTIFVEAKEILESTNIVGDVYFTDQGRKVPLVGIKAVLNIGANQRIDYVDSSGKFEFNNIDFDSRVSYLIHFEMTDGKSFNFIDSQLYDTNTVNPPVIKSRTMLLNIDETLTTNNFAISLGLNMPSSYSSTDTYYINKAFDLQSKVVNFYNRILNEKPPMINVFLFQDGSWYQSTIWDRSSANYETYVPKIGLRAGSGIWSGIGMEYTHYVQDFSYNKMHGYDTQPRNSNHLGYDNPSTADSWVEGVGTFMPALIANWYNMAEAGTFSYTSLERNDFKPTSENMKWSPYWLDEEYAIATLLWDLYDRKQDGENISLSVTEIWRLIDGFDDFQKYNSQDYMKKYSYYESINSNERHIKYFKDFYDYMSDYDVNHDGQINSSDQKMVDEVFALHGIPNGYTNSEKTRV